MKTWRPMCGAALLSVLAAACACAAAPDTATLPFVGKTGLPVVRVTLNGRYDAEFLIDTTSTVSLIRKSVTARLGLTPSPLLIAGAPATANGIPVDGVTASIKVGALGSADMQFAVPPDSRLDAGDLLLDGTLGQEFLLSHAALFDLPARTVTFWDHGGLTNAERTAVGMGAAGSVLITREAPSADSPPCFYVPVALNGELKVSIPFRTEQATTTIPAEAVTRLGLKELGMEPALVTASVPSSVVHYRAVRPQSLTVGPVTAVQPLVYFTTDTPPRVPVGLGLDVLRQFRVLLDAAAHEFYLKEVPGARSAPEPGPCSEYKLPVRFSGPAGAPLVLVDTGDGKPRPFFIFASARFNAIDPGLAQVLHLEPIRPQPSDVVGADVVNVSAKLGGYQLPQQHFICTPVKAAAPDLDCTGAIGSALLGVGLRINFSAGSVTLLAPAVNGLMPSPGDGWTAVPLEQQDRNACVEVSVDGTPFHPRLSLTAPLTVLPGGLSGDPLKASAKVSYESILHDSGTLTRAGELSVGGARVPEPLVLRPDHAGPGDTRLGLDFFRHFEVFIDYWNAMMYLRPDPNYRSDSHSVAAGTGITWGRGAGTEIEVYSVIRESPAGKAGIQPGDRILTIDGKPADTMTEEELCQALMAESGPPVQVKIERKGGTDQAVYTLQRSKLL